MTDEAKVVATLLRAVEFAIPEAILALAACVLFIGGTFRANRHWWAIVALAGLAAASVVLSRIGTPQVLPAAAASPLLLDHFAILVKVMALVGGTVLVLLSWNELPDSQAADYHACLLITVAGLGLAGSANDLVTLFLSLELISIPTYVLLYLPRTGSKVQESAVKYFLLSVFSSALLLFGFSYLYGMAGTTNLTAIVEALTRTESQGDAAALPGVAQIALVMVVAGLGFKIAAVPFHFYAPDVYQGAPTPVAALLAFIPKVAGFVALIRVLGFVWTKEASIPGLALGLQVPTLLWILATMTMFLGNVLALLQDNLKRLLAYSSVAHAGYMLIGLTVARDLALSAEPSKNTGGGVDAVLFYLVAYGAMTVGAFAVLSYLSTPQRPVENVDDLAGLSGSHPGIALLMALFLFGLIGIPFTAGFWGKLFLFFGALGVPARPPLEEHARLFRLLAVIGAINAAIGAWYYLRILSVMYLRSSIKPLEKQREWPGLAAMWICAAVTLAFGVYPEPLAKTARQAVLPERTEIQQARQ